MEMNLLLYLLTCLSYVTALTYRDPCEKISLIFTSTAAPSKEYVHKIQLENTYSLVKIGSYCIEYWYGLRYAEPLSRECDFFTNQDYLLNDILDYPIVRPLEVQLFYSLDPSTKKYVFKLYVKGLLVSVFDGYLVKRVKYSSRQLDPKVVDVIKQFAYGRSGSMLTQYAKEFDETWRTICGMVKNRSNSRDEYRLWYNPSTDRVYCSVKTVLAWQREIHIGRHRVKADWTYGGGQYFILGSIPRGDEVDFTCIIVATNGLVARQQLFVRPEHIRPRTTRRPQTTRAKEKTGEGSTPTKNADHSFVSRSESTHLSFGSAPVPEFSPTTDLNWVVVTRDEAEGASEKRTGSAATTAVIVVVVAAVLGIAIALFVFRGRILNAGNGCLRRARGPY